VDDRTTPRMGDATMETNAAYWFNGSAYCAACVESEDAPCLGESQEAQATIGDGEGRCACCGRSFDGADVDEVE
jgi:hypothetical protein